MVKAGYIEFNNGRRVFHNSPMGVPQGGIINPLLSNLMLNELDLYIKTLKDGLDENSKGQA